MLLYKECLLNFVLNKSNKKLILIEYLEIGAQIITFVFYHFNQKTNPCCLMIKLLLSLEWKKFNRSPSFDRLIIEKIVLTILKGLMILIFYSIGSSAVELFNIFEIDKPIQFVSGYIISYFLIEFSVRYFIQKLPKFDIVQYLHLPIKKSVIVHYLLGRSFINFLNIAAILLFLPFSREIILSDHGYTSAFFWITHMILLSWTLHWVVVWIQSFPNNFNVFLIVACVVLIINSFKYFEISHITDYLGSLLMNAFFSPYSLFILLATFLFTYWFTHKRLTSSINNDIPNNRIDAWADHSLDFLNKYGLSGKFAEIEWKLILRHKRSKQILLFSLIWLVYGVFLFNKKSGNIEDLGGYNLIIPGLLATGALLMNYGQYFLSWNTSHFDFYLVKPHGLASLIKGKLYILTFSVFVYTILATPYLYFGLFFYVATISMALLNIGILVHFITYISLYKPEPMDINDKAAFNYDGLGCAQMVMGLPIFLFPMILYGGFKFLLGAWGAVVGIGLVGIIGLVLFPYLSSFTIARAEKNKHSIAENFRNRKF